MSSEKFSFKPIGFLYTPFTNPKTTPIQPLYDNDLEGTLEVNEEYVEGLKDLEGFSHIYVIYQPHATGRPKLRIKPLMQNVERGIFATRAHRRPNPLGLAVLKLEKIEGNILYVTGVDMLDGTAVIDIKPYCDRFDKVVNARGGWTQSCAEEGE
ncbi:MAG: tRNA (N6-threonylcarbamoyladenosine(37)-N6)-methyltransferase TrmO [Deltaproteobacteria bacterium]|nr:tRNA (N6-threonylcarbamoyladenosine(37)-N6)-methyltransferase TrmO [Deltaproteobacteria bacterium]